MCNYILSSQFYHYNPNIIFAITYLLTIYIIILAIFSQIDRYLYLSVLYLPILGLFVSYLHVLTILRYSIFKTKKVLALIVEFTWL